MCSLDLWLSGCLWISGSLGFWVFGSLGLWAGPKWVVGSLDLRLVGRWVSGSKGQKHANFSD